MMQQKEKHHSRSRTKRGYLPYPLFLFPPCHLLSLQRKQHPAHRIRPRRLMLSLQSIMTSRSRCSATPAVMSSLTSPNQCSISCFRRRGQALSNRKYAPLPRRSSRCLRRRYTDIRRQVSEDMHAAYLADPAARGPDEVIVAYPTVTLPQPELRIKTKSREP